MNTIISLPHAKRTFEALRSLGYDLNSAVADITDNAVSEKVKAKNIFIYFKRSNDHFICRILDDGIGMANDELEESMRIGAESSYGENELGKFGLGMKTASLSHCNILTVISKTKKSSVAGYRWDMREVKGSKWCLLQLNNKEINEILENEELKLSDTGTIVLWDDLFLLDKNYKTYTSSKLAEGYHFRLLDELKLYMRMVYHRFLDHMHINININGMPLKPWNPFFTNERNTIKLNLSKDLSVLPIPGYEKPVIIRAYILPNKESFSSERTWEEAKGLLSWNDSQGYYIYRANRLIRYGGWHGTKAKDEHDKLARISLDIDPSLDSLFRITVNKSKVQFPEILFNHLKNKVNKSVIKEAQKQYRKSDEKPLFKNKLRNQGNKLARVSKTIVRESNIKTQKKDAGNIEVNNPSGSYLSNKIHEFLKYGTDKAFEVVSGELDNDHLWKIVCNENEKFKVIINSNHPFYTKIYSVGKNKAFTSAIDALICSLAFAELYNRNKNNSNLFDTFKTVSSNALKKLTEEELV
jgi:hypothetical protein